MDGSPAGWISLGPRKDYAKLQRSPILKPVDKPERSHNEFMFFGARSLYERAGFTEVVRRSPTRVVMRRELRPRVKTTQTVPNRIRQGITVNN